MSYDPCRICGEWGWTDTHKCPPRWDIYCPENGDEPDHARSFYAIDAEAAAEKWAERYDEYDEPSIARQDFTPTVCVRRYGTDDVWERWTVSGEYVPQYYAREAEAPTPTPSAPATAHEAPAPEASGDGEAP